MIVIAANTEKRLLEDLSLCVRENPNQKCFFVQSSQLEIDKKILFEKFLKILDQLPNSYMAQIYLCDDKDIFIVMNGFMQRQFLEFIKLLSMSVNDKQLNDVIDVFEVRIHWDKLEKICHDKIVAIDVEKQRLADAARQKEIDDLTLEIFETLDVDLIHNLTTRRENRDEPTILVVDDDQISRMLVYNVLSSDYKMAFAKTGKEALKEYLNNAPDVLFLDIGLPDINGHILLEIFSQIDPKNYIIMFSGRKDKENIYKALRLGAQGFVGKPFSRDELIHHIAQSPHIKNNKINKLNTSVTV